MIGVFKPSFLYDSNKLNAEQIARNKRIWNRSGLVLIALGILDLIFSLTTPK